MKALGVDFGERRVGLALSDPQGRFALPLTTLERRDDRALIGELRAVAEREEVELLVVGEPQRPDGTAHPQAPRVRRFGERLARACRLPVEFVPETLSTVEAAARLRASGLSPERFAPGLDAAAAQLILQEALDRRASR